MFLKAFFFALALCSISAEDLDCKQLLQPLKDQHPIPGKYIMLAAGSNNKDIFGLMKKLNNSWIELSSTDVENMYHVTVADKMEDMCFFRKGVAHVGKEKTTLELMSGVFDSKHEGKYLQTLDDNFAVWLDQTSYTQGKRPAMEGKNILLLKRTEGEVATDEIMERFKSQVKCASIDFYDLVPTNDLCAKKELSEHKE